MEQKTNNLEAEFKEENMKLQDKLITLECKLLENSMKFRGESGKNVREEMTIILEFVEIPLKRLKKNVKTYIG